MKIIKPYARIIVLANNNLKFIESAARVSHRSEEDQTENTTEKFINAVVMKHGDWSVVEHSIATVEFLVDRGITHEIVRHRLFSYTQESTRFVNYAKKMTPNFIYPIPGVWCDKSEDHTFIAAYDHDCIYSGSWLCAIQECERVYQELLKQGWRPQEARSVFPNALASKLIMTGNLRNWRHFFIMRTTKEAHPQMRQVTIPLLAEFKSKVPILFDDVIPESTQSENLRLPR